MSMPDLDTPDLEMIKDARIRASVAATTGTVEARSGLFTEKFAMQNYVKILLREAEAAARTWAQWLAINDELGNEELQSALKRFDCVYAADITRLALLRDAFLGAFRLIDPVGSKPPDFATGSVDDSRYTFCAIAKYLAGGGGKAIVTRPDWVIDQGYSQKQAIERSRTNTELVDAFLGRVPSDWKHADALPDQAFSRLRETLKPWRNVIAHSVGLEAEPSKVTLGQIDDFIKATLRLATDMSYVFVGSRGPGVEAESIEMASAEEAKRYWRPMFQGLLDQRRKALAEADKPFSELLAANP